MLSDDLAGWDNGSGREDLEGGIYIHLTDPPCCIAEANSIVKQLCYNFFLQKDKHVLK